MKKSIFNLKILLISGIVLTFFSNAAFAYWLWTPETKKFVNPKYAVKDSPKEQFDWAMSFYNAKDYQRAVMEFEKLVKQYEYSEYASDAQYYVGLSYENMGKLYIAYQNYQKAVDNFPHIENIDEIIAREFNIANFYATKDNPKVLGMEIMMALDRAIEIYKKVVDNAPYGKLAEESQFRMGEAMKKAERYDEAIQAFQKVVDDYPNSKFADKAKYETAYCAYKASLKPAYDIQPTDKAIKAFQDFAETNQDKTLSKEADKTVQRLKDKAAEKSMITARFYESQRHYESAIIYYQEVLDKFPDCSFVNEAKSKIEKLSAVIKGRETKANTPSQPWNAIKFAAKPKPKAEKPPKIAKAKVPSKPWNPLKIITNPKPKPKPKPKKEETVKAASVAKPQKKSWNPFTFAGKAKPKTEEAPKVVKAKAWNPIKFAVKPKPKVEKAAKVEKAPKVEVTPKAEETPKIEEAPKTEMTPKIEEAPKAKEVPKAQEVPKLIKAKPWSPIKFASKPKPKETPAQDAKPKPQKKAWSPFNLASSAKKKPVVEQSQEPKSVKAKAWSPFKFASKPKSKEVPVQAAKPKPQKKAWSPFKFASKPKPKETPAQSVTTDENSQNKKSVSTEAPKAVRLKGWKPLNFASKPKSEKAPDQIEAAPLPPKVETVSPAVEAQSAPVVKDAAGGKEETVPVPAPDTEVKAEPQKDVPVTLETVPVDNTDEPKNQEVR